MSWNYRVVRGRDPDGSVYYTIRTAYYAKPGLEAPDSIGDPAYASGRCLSEVQKDLALMLAAFDKSPLDEAAFIGVTKK